MSPIYQTISGKIQATMEGGRLFIRTWEANNPLGEWRELVCDAEHAEDQRKVCPQSQTYWGCIRDCLTGKRESPWYIQPLSEGVAAKIAALRRQLKAARIAEALDRPKLGGNP